MSFDKGLILHVQRALLFRVCRLIVNMSASLDVGESHSHVLVPFTHKCVGPLTLHMILQQSTWLRRGPNGISFMDPPQPDLRGAWMCGACVPEKTAGSRAADEATGGIQLP